MSEWNGAGARGTDRAREQADAESGETVLGVDGPQAEGPTDIDLLRRVLLALGGTLPQPPPAS